MNIKTQNSPTLPAEATLVKTGQSEGVEGAPVSRRQERLARAQERKDGYAVDLSPAAKDLKEAHAKALDIARNTPEVREERVRQLKERIKNGTYQVDSGKVADGMLREAIRDQLAQGEPSR